MGDDDLWRTLHEIAAMPYGAGQIAGLEQMLRRVDAGTDRHLAFATRMHATTSYIYGGEPAKSFVTFSWCLAEFDRDPQPYHERYAHNLLWSFKYMVNGMLKFPEVPLDRTYAVLDDMERRYREGGHSLQAVHKHRYRVADHLGATDDAERWYRLWQTTPRDDLSDCAGCDPTTQVEHLTRTGRYDEAVALAEPVLAGRLTCTEQPQAILTALLWPYLRSGRRDAARDAHREAYRRLRGNLADLGDIADHVEFCTVTGNEARAVEIVERHLDWLDRAPSPSAAMQFAASASAALRQVPGGAGVTLHRRAAGDRPAGAVPAETLAAELAETATALAERFDRRNGTSHQSELVALRLAAGPTGEHLPLSASLRRRPARPAAPAPSGTTDRTTDWTGTPVPARPAVRVPADATREQLLDLAETCWQTHRPDDFAEVLRAYDERFGTDPDVPVGQHGPDPDAGGPGPDATGDGGPGSGQTGGDRPDGDGPARLAAARRLELRAAERGNDADDPAAAVAANRAALAAYRDLPDEVRAQVVAGRLGVQLCMTEDDIEEGLALTRGSVEFLDRHGDARQRVAARDRLAMALLQAHRAAEALTEVDRAAAGAAVDPHLAARVALHRTAVLEQLDRPDEFRSAAAEARRLAREVAADELVAAAGLAHARAVDDPAEAVRDCDEVLRVGSAAVQLPARVTRARALLAADRADEAVEDYAEAVTLCVEQQAPGDAFLRWELANAYQAAGRLSEAAEVAEEAVLGLDRLGAQAEADRCRHLLAGVYERLGDTEPALALLDRLADNLDGPDNLPHRAQVLEEAGGILYDADRDVLAAQRFAAAATAYRLAGLPVEELRARRRETAALFWSGDLPAALAAVEVVDRAVAALAGQPDEPPVVTYEVALAADIVARVLTGDERLTEALDRLAGVPDRLRSIGAFAEAAQAELLAGELLLRTDRPDDAERLLRTVLGGLPVGGPLAGRAAWLLTATLERLGRTAEARALREEHGLPDD
ncbi:hypothetical protein [Micromonospora zhanjiangensis]|uniref:Tetratricopeptide repeat protein n=1 Tax=Micromonospora zhanjiangensis TaxID=1522057 RepID=A0ABV8KTJ1_9ACTN